MVTGKQSSSIFNGNGWLRYLIGYVSWKLGREIPHESGAGGIVMSSRFEEVDATSKL